jgi:hypothetical protein
MENTAMDTHINMAMVMDLMADFSEKKILVKTDG